MQLFCPLLGNKNLVYMLYQPYFFKSQLRWFRLKWVYSYPRFRNGKREWVCGHYRKVWITTPKFPNY